MFFGLSAVDDHPCCKMQVVVEDFFQNAIAKAGFSADLFPEWIRATLANPTCTLGAKFESVHALLHASGVTVAYRRKVCEQMFLTNRVAELCEGTLRLPINVIDWNSPLGKAVVSLMSSLYDSLDLAVFRKMGHSEKPTYQLYGEFIEKNKYVCPFCGLDRFKNRRGARREDFDHYLHKFAYPLAAANMRNLVPTCGTCNQDYKKTKDILEDGSAFYPYAGIPEVRIEVDCQVYPAMDNLDDEGKWSVKLELTHHDPVAIPKMKAWDRVYSIKERLEHEIQEFGEYWMIELYEGQQQPLEREGFLALIASARTRALQGIRHRIEPKQIIKAAFFDFMLSKAGGRFVESFRRSQNRRCSLSIANS